MRIDARGIAEDEELEVATEVLSAANDDVLGRLLGSVIDRVARRAGRSMPAGVGSALRDGILKVARALLPNLAAAPDVRGLRDHAGGRGEHDTERAGRLLGLEFEGLSPEDQELETARSVVRLAARAATHALHSPLATVDPVATARRALLEAARAHAPGVLADAIGGFADLDSAGAASGEWVRRGGDILVIGA